MMKQTSMKAWLILSMLGLLAACGEESAPQTQDDPAADDFMPVLSPLDTVVTPESDIEAGSVTDFGAKFDLTLPSKFDLLATQSSVRNQQSRGVCSIFASVGLMEHLYIKEGSIPNPDFSEQYLQWSAKFEVRAFPNTSGSSNDRNLDAIIRFGIPEEAAWPYEGREWGASQNPECQGDEGSRPTLCFTNGEPPQAALDARKFKLPKKNWVSANTKSIKTYMVKEQSAVAAGGTFFYQSWSHGASPLGINANNRAKGFVTYPNARDKETSLAKRAGHAFLLVGFDDNLTAPVIDEQGNPVVDPNTGNPVVEQGFFLFKNSWGLPTSRTGWSGSNELAPGYGWISYRYVEEYLQVQGAPVPVVEPEAPKVELCGDGLDNDDNGLADCDDAVCAMEAACQPAQGEKRVYEGNGGAIPDNDVNGVELPIEVELDGAVTDLVVSVEIAHSWIGDLDVALISPDGDILVLVEGDGKRGDSLSRQFQVEGAVGKAAAGTWALYVSDNAKFDTGNVTGWSLTITN